MGSGKNVKMTYSFRAGAILYSFLKELPRNGVVILPINACHDVLFTVLKSGSEVRFVDIDPLHLELDYEKVWALISSKIQVKAIVHIHTYGRVSVPINRFQEIRKLDRSIAIVDDCCLCRPDFHAVLPESVDLRIFSTGPSKYLNLPYGGVGLSHVSVKKYTLPYDAEAYSELLGFWKAVPGLSEELFRFIDRPWLQTEFGPGEERNFCVQIEACKKRLCEIDLHKRQVNALYDAGLRDWALPEEFNQWRYQIRLPNKKIRDRIFEAIFEAGLFCSHHYPLLAPNQAGRYPIAEELHNTILNLFNEKLFSKEQAVEIIRIIRMCFAEEGL